MPWTPLHAALGVDNDVLDFDLVRRACEEKVAERADLDWKRALPLTAAKGDHAAKQRQQTELAKDIGAMANSGGGMIVYGVQEASRAGTSAAESIQSVGQVDENTSRDIRRVAGNLVYPPVTALDLMPLTDSVDPDLTVLALIVPDSPDRPHLVHPTNGRDWFGSPYRHGPETEWMVERQLAAAYAERESGRRRRESDLQDRFDEFVSGLPQNGDLRWVTAIAVPEQPHPRPPLLDPLQGDRFFERAWNNASGRRFGPADLLASEPTRRGLRRCLREGSRSIRAAAPARARAKAEIHRDGTVAVAFTRDGAIYGEGWQPTQVPLPDIEQTALDFIAVLLRVRRELGIVGDYSARLTVHPATEIFRSPDPILSGHMVPWNEQRVLGYRPIDSSLPGTATVELLLSAWAEMIVDAVNQAGASTQVTGETIAASL